MILTVIILEAANLELMSSFSDGFTWGQYAALINFISSSATVELKSCFKGDVSAVTNCPDFDPTSLQNVDTIYGIAKWTLPLKGCPVNAVKCIA